MPDGMFALKPLGRIVVLSKKCQNSVLNNAWSRLSYISQLFRPKSYWHTQRTIPNYRARILHCCVQQLYLYVGLLVINATINSAPLKVIVRIAKIGALWQILGWPLDSA